MAETEVNMKKKGKHDKPKPWDDDPNIDHWKIEKFEPSWNGGGMLDVSSFSTLFPQYREKYLQEAWPMVKSALKEFGISCELNLVRICLSFWFREWFVSRIFFCFFFSFSFALFLWLFFLCAQVEGSMTVSTTRKTRDPYIIIKARDLIKLLSRSVPAPQVQLLFNIGLGMKSSLDK